MLVLKGKSMFGEALASFPCIILPCARACTGCRSNTAYRASAAQQQKAPCPTNVKSHHPEAELQAGKPQRLLTVVLWAGDTDTVLPDGSRQLPSQGPPMDIASEQLSVICSPGQTHAGDLRVKCFSLLIPSSHLRLSLIT